MLLKHLFFISHKGDISSSDIDLKNPHAMIQLQLSIRLSTIHMNEDNQEDLQNPSSEQSQTLIAKISDLVSSHLCQEPSKGVILNSRTFHASKF